MDCIAVVVADTEEQAADAAKAIHVEYEDLPGVFDHRIAIEDSQPQIHEGNPNNVLCRYRIRKGDMDAGWSTADVIVEGTYDTGYQEHAYLQPEAGLGYIDDEGRITVAVAGQWNHDHVSRVPGAKPVRRHAWRHSGAEVQLPD